MPVLPDLLSPDNWPAHWIRPTEADLRVQEAGYARGFLPPHDPRLHQRSAEVVVGSVECDDTVALMQEVAALEKEAANGRPIVGLSAVQVGRLHRAILFDPREEVSDFGAAPELVCVLNPEVAAFGLLVEDGESCLSTGRIRGLPKRPKSVRLTGVTPDGYDIDAICHGRAARVLQHEAGTKGHINGGLITDLLPDEELLYASTHQMPEYLRYLLARRAGSAVAPWAIHFPRDQVEAMHNGLPVFGGVA